METFHQCEKSCQNIQYLIFSETTKEIKIKIKKIKKRPTFYMIGQFQKGQRLGKLYIFLVIFFFQILKPRAP